MNRIMSDLESNGYVVGYTDTDSVIFFSCRLPTQLPPLESIVKLSSNRFGYMKVEQNNILTFSALQAKSYCLQLQNEDGTFSEITKLKGFSLIRNITAKTDVTAS